jgi:hypothetical protein
MYEGVIRGTRHHMHRIQHGTYSSVLTMDLFERPMEVLIGQAEPWKIAYSKSAQLGVYLAIMGNDQSLTFAQAKDSRKVSSSTAFRLPSSHSSLARFHISYTRPSLNAMLSLIKLLRPSCGKLPSGTGMNCTPRPLGVNRPCSKVMSRMQDWLRDAVSALLPMVEGEPLT